MSDAYRVGARFGRLTVTADLGIRDRRHLVECRCDCGSVRTVRASNLKSGNTTSCGCVSVEQGRARRTHGLTKTSVYWRWRAMIQRCTNPKNHSYPNYGGRGITVCDRWRSFEAFHADMGEPPSGATLDRINNNGNYEPGNCRWVTPSRQARNWRKTPMLTYQGRTQSLIDWAEELGINFRTLHTRLKRPGWTVEKALSTPIGPNAGRRV